MKALAIALILFLLIITIVVLNAIFVERTIIQAQELSITILKNDKASLAVDKLWDFWQDRSRLLSLSVSKREIDAATENLLLFKTAYSEGNTYLSKQYCNMFCKLLEDILRYEKISISSLF